MNSVIEHITEYREYLNELTSERQSQTALCDTNSKTHFSGESLLTLPCEKKLK